MSETQELMKAQREACNLETLTNWKGWMPHIKPIGCMYVRGEARRYYKHKYSERYFYRRVSESEMHRHA